MVQSAFSLKELRELSKIDGIELFLYKPDIIECMTESSVIEAQEYGKCYAELKVDILLHC